MKLLRNIPSYTYLLEPASYTVSCKEIVFGNVSQLNFIHRIKKGQGSNRVFCDLGKALDTCIIPVHNSAGIMYCFFIVFTAHGV